MTESSFWVTLSFHDIFIMKKLISVLAVLCLGMTLSWADEGMWMINGIDKALEKQMKKRGLKLSAKEIYNADAEGATISDAVVSLDFGCTGSVISDAGLVITNHHCAYSDVHALSTDEKNYLEDGFWAMSRDEEIPIPGKNMYFLKKVLDVTDEVKALQEEYRRQGKHFGMRKISFEIEKKYRSDAGGMDVSLASMWGGEKYYMMFYEVYSDIRLVAAPPVSFAAFGGDIDNWEWPQHKCDFAMYRIYTAPDGSPAGYSEDNIPLEPEMKLTVSTAGYKPGDFTMVIGYPGRTNRYSSSAEVNFEERVTLPISNRLRGEQMEIVNRWMNTDPSIRLKYSDYYFSLSNVQEMNCGKEKNIRRFGVVESKAAQERDLQAWIDADPERQARWGEVIPMLDRKYADVEEAERDINYYRETLVRGTALSRMSTRLNLLKREVLKKNRIRMHTVIDQGGPDSTELNFCRRFRFCGRDYDAVRKNLLGEYDHIVPDVEKDLFRYAVSEFYENIDRSVIGPWQKELYSRFSGPDGQCDYDAMTEYLWTGSILTDKSRLEAFISEEHTVDEYLADPLFRFFQDLKIITLNRRTARVEGKPDILTLDKEYTHAMYEKALSEGTPQYPDANSTMRITYGTVGDIQPYDAVTWSWRSTTAGVLEKYDPSSYEFGMEDRQLELLKEADWGRWADKDGSMHVNFLTDNDITGGNSGSPVMNSKGELIGLAFDGNKESLASDVYYVDGYTKCVCVDIRYVLWVLDSYAGMDWILDEIGI